MSSIYIEEHDPNPDAPRMSVGCRLIPKDSPGEGGEMPGGYINDVIGEGCWAAHAKPVPIGDTRASVHEGFEYCNFYFKVASTQASLPNSYYLPGIFV